MYIEITHDTFDISKRLLDLDENYFIRFNKKTNKFEIWLKEGVNAHLEMVMPYPCLDIRTIHKVANSKAEKIDSIISKMESENLRLQKQNEQHLKDELSFKLRVMLNN